MKNTQHFDTSQYCGRIITREQVPAWHALRREQALFDLEAMRDTLGVCALTVPARRPRLIFGESDAAIIRERAGEEVREHIRRECDTLTAEPADHVEGRLAFYMYMAAKARKVAGGFLVLQDERYADWVRRRIEALLALPSWMGDVHKSFIKRCDHIMANVGADLACAHDWLGDAADNTFTDRLAEGLRNHLLLPFLEGARKRDEHWSQDTYLANWKIMTCGETGVAVCAFADRWPEAREALTLSAEGVLEILDVIPREGDWPEGVGYWYATLFMGLRFGLALRRLSGGAVDLLAHPRLAVTGDFGAAHISPSGRVFNYGDNPEIFTNPHCAEALLILGMEKKRAEWRAAARRFPSYSPLWLHLDDPDAENAPMPDGAYLFPATGAAILRWGSTFVGMRSGDSEAGHAHLDSNSFVLETRGAPALVEAGLWPYAHFLGFFHLGQGYDGKRWNFDALATIGHNALIVDGRGQAHGTAYAGRVHAPGKGDGWMLLTGDGSACYPGLLKKWRRSLLLIGEEWLVIRDVIVCDGARHVEWLIHPGHEYNVEKDTSGSNTSATPTSWGECRVRDGGDDTIVEVGGAGVRIIPLLPDRKMGWRVSDVIRRSVYENSNTGAIERPAIRYRSFAPFQAAEFFEFLFLVRLDGTEPGNYEFAAEGESWRLDLPTACKVVRPEVDSLIVAGCQ